MEKIIADPSVRKLIPSLSEQEKEELRLYFNVSLKYQKELRESALEELKDHEVIGKLIKSIPKEVADANQRLSQELQTVAILHDNWEPYVKYQIEQGITYAKMGLDFKSWYEVVNIFKKITIPYLRLEFKQPEKFSEAFNGMSSLIDIGMCIIGEAYIKEKEEIISEEQQKIEKLNNELELKVIERTLQLEGVNKELEAFSYSVSHDLRAPLRAISGYADMLKEDFGGQINEEGNRIIGNIGHYATKMGTLIDELLAFSRLGRKNIQKSQINMSNLVEGVIIEINKTMKHNARIKVDSLPNILADYSLLYQIVFNLVSNAVKYSSKIKKPVIEIKFEEQEKEIIFFVSDNGVGFDMKYSDKLFDVFQRLHSNEEFDGSGVGLAIVHRLISKHGGRVWVDAAVNEGATFYFTLPKTDAL